MKTIILSLFVLGFTSCSRVNEDVKLEIENLDSYTRSAAALSEMRILTLSLHLGANTWMAEKFESVNKAMFKGAIKGREYSQAKEKLRFESKNWPINRKEKLKTILALSDSLLSSYEEITTILQKLEDYENPRQYLQARSIYDDNEVAQKNMKILDGLSQLQKQFASDIENSIAALKQNVSK